MGELLEWLAKPIERRRFMRGSSHAVLGAMAAFAGGGGLQVLSGPPALAREQQATAGAPGTSTVKGMTLSGLQTGSSQQTLAKVEEEIAASKNNFGATHIRLQIQQQTFIGNGSQYNPSYASTVYNAINYALSLGLTVIVNCQTEQAGVNRTYNYPNEGDNATSQFWKYMLTTQGGNFGGNPRVICDLFNEPKAPDWTTWQAAYNEVIKYIRSGLGITGNQLWADTNDYANSFDGCPGLTDPAGNLIYSFHHPKSGPSGDTAGWDTDFGNWAATHPVVNGEFAQNSNFNWGSPYEIQHYLSYCASKGIGHTLWTVYGDGYFSDANFMPYGWWGNMINNFWNPGNGWTTYCFRSSVAWSQNYVVHTGAQLPWTNGLYQGWSVEENSMLAGVAGFNSFVPDMATGTQYRMHVSFQCVHANTAGTCTGIGTTSTESCVTAIVGVHGVSSAPSTWSGVSPHATNIVELTNLTDNHWYNVDIPSDYLARFASGYYKGVVFGPGPSSAGVYEGHMSFSPEVVIEVHA